MPCLHHQGSKNRHGKANATEYTVTVASVSGVFAIYFSIHFIWERWMKDTQPFFNSLQGRLIRQLLAINNEAI